MKKTVAIASALVALATSCPAARWDGGRLLVEEGPNKKLTVESNLAWLKAGKVPEESVGNVIRWLEFRGVDCTEFRKKHTWTEPPLGEPLMKRKDFRLGYMLDISRDKVPTLETLKRIADILAACGFNEFQLYTEVVFASKKHPEASRGWSPVTPDDIRELNDYCWKKGITLTPNQNSFGHMEKLFRVPKYRHLANVLDDQYEIKVWPYTKGAPAALCPSDPEVLSFLGDLYDEEIPLFTHADRINVGCDEVWELEAANARSAARVAKVGMPRVYTDHLLDVYRLCKARNRTMLFWADMIYLNFDLLDELPKDFIPINWGYGGEEKGYPGYTCEFEGRCIVLKRRGIRFYVGPSVNTWGSYFGRIDTMRANLDMVTAAGRKYDACGLLLTSWGDGGHRNPWLIDVPGIVYTAAKARGEEMTDAQLAAAVDTLVGSRVGEALIALGRVDERKPSAAGVAAARAALAKADRAKAAPWVANALDTLALGIEILEARVNGNLEEVFPGYAERFRKTWLFDNREGGLEESLKHQFRDLEDRPRLTIEPGGITPKAALERVRDARAQGDATPWKIRVKGVNELTEPIVLTEKDHDIAFVGDKGASFSGGLALGGWKDLGNGVWEADAPRRTDGKPMFFDQLWANGRRAPNARFPNEGWLQTEVSAASQTVFRVEGDVTTYRELVVFTNDSVRVLGDVPEEDWPHLEAGIICNWAYGLRSLVSYDRGRNAVTFETPVKWEGWKWWRPGTIMLAFFNVRSSFDAPGEWFLDMKAGKVRYRPLPGETLAAFTCVVPRAGLSRLVDFRGDWRNGKAAARIAFRNIDFTYTSTVTDRNLPEELVMHQAAIGMDGAVTAEGIREVSFENCRVAHTANYAMRFNSGCVSNRVVNCTLEDGGAGGIWMGADYMFAKMKSEIPRQILKPVRKDAVAFNLISNCTIRTLGRYNPEGTGVALTHCSDTRVVHNDIYDVYYTGVSVGWTWGFYGSVAQRNEIAFNRIYDLGKGVMSDMGGVYTLGTSFGTTVHDNVIHDVKSKNYGGWGLYTDEGSEGIVMENNLVWNTTDAGFHQHFGTGCIIRNNIFAWNRLGGAVRTRRKVVFDIPCSLYFANNIVLIREGSLCGTGVSGVYGLWANNLWYDVRGLDQAVFEKTDWKGWCACGKETGGQFADPEFVDADRFDFHLKPTSPAFKLGFKPFDYTRAGRKASAR